MEPPIVVLIDPDERRGVVARRLRAQGFQVEVYACPAEGANAILAAPPQAVVADLWMPGISGVQLTRLLTAEPATAGVPVVLRATSDEPRNRFWARHAGAAAYVPKGRMGELARAIHRVATPQDRTPFFLHLGQAADVRDRISAHLDRALFESVLAGEIRALGSLGTFDRLLDDFSQLLVQVTSYRWMAIARLDGRVGLHCRPERRDAAVAEMEAALGESFPADRLVAVEDDDAEGDERGLPVVTASIRFGQVECGRFALAPTARSDADRALVDFVARELGGPLRMVALVEETQRLAVTDTLTGLLRRGPLVDRLAEDLRGSDGAVRWTVLLLDLDRFKQINDQHGHSTGDRVLQLAGAALADFAARTSALAGRWGGEEFVLAIPGLTAAAGLELAEDLRRTLADLDLVVNGTRVPVTASIGIAREQATDSIDALIDRADLAMYAAKTAGRNRVAEDRGGSGRQVP